MTGMYVNIPPILSVATDFSLAEQEIAEVNNHVRWVARGVLCQVHLDTPQRLFSCRYCVSDRCWGKKKIMAKNNAAF